MKQTYSLLRLPEASRRLAGAWFLLALASLGASALLALALVAARTPFLGFGSGVFRTALVLHVDMAVLVWFLAAAAGVWVLVRGKADALGWGAFWLSAGAVLLLLLSPMLGEAPPMLSNYVPVLDSAIFQLALAAFFAGVLVTALCLTWRWPRDLPPWGLAARWSAVVMLLVALVFAWDYFQPAAADALTLDELTWGGGHLLQFLHIVLMLGAWSVVGERLLARMPSLARALPWLMVLTVLPALGGVVVSLLLDAGSSMQRLAYTELMRWGSWPAAIALGCALLYSAWHDWRSGVALEGEEKVLLLSVLLFMAGCMVGAGIQGNATLSVPAHYHGTVGSVTLAYLLLARRLLIAYGLQPPAADRTIRLPLLYGLGIAVLVAGLAWSGWQGVARKAPHAEVMQSGVGYLTAMGLAGVGGFLALAAVLLLVAVLLTAVMRGMARAKGQGGMRAGFVLLAAIPLAIGLLLPALRESPAPSEDIKPEAHVREKVWEEIDLRFKQGVAMLHARQFDHALTAFRRVLALAPNMPEAHANIGFALLGKQDYVAAADMFDRATTLRPEQINAYYGMAVALEGMGNLRAAIEAMRAYLHRAPADDPYRKKAEAAVWEWQAEVGRQSAEADINNKKGP